MNKVLCKLFVNVSGLLNAECSKAQWSDVTFSYKNVRFQMAQE